MTVFLKSATRASNGFSPSHSQALVVSRYAPHKQAMSILDWQEISAAAQAIRDGNLVGMPTETVYGLAGDATNDMAVAGIFAAKGRPGFNPLIAHVASLEMATALAQFSPLALRLARAFWPGPMTLVLPKSKTCSVSALACAGLDSLALRMPAHPVARALLEAVGRPLAAPSANPSGRISPTKASHVRDGLGDKLAMILEGEACCVGLESTILKVIDDRVIVLRPGGVSREAIEATLGIVLETSLSSATTIEAPGMMSSHYAPLSPIRLNVTDPRDDEVWLGFGDKPETPPGTMLWLSGNGDLTQAAASLFAHLHRADDLCGSGAFKGIAVAPIPDHGLGVAINDRLSRAAA